MKKSTRTVSTLALASTMALPMSGSVQASSHREAPFITSMPKVDATDLYTFRSYAPGRQDFVTIIANYYPLQEPGAGPNYFMMDPHALYEIHIDNNGDAKEDMSFQFQFKNDLAAGGTGIALDIAPPAMKVEIPLINSAPTIGDDRSKLNVEESYTVKLARNGRRTAATDVVNSVGDVKKFIKPTDYIGTKSFPKYADYAKAHEYDIKVPGCNGQNGMPALGRMFVGQRKEGFAVNVGTIFDLINDTDAATITDPNKRGAVPNPLDTKNVTTIALELPIACVLAGAQKTIGTWTTASLRQARVLDPKPSFARQSLEGGAWTQVSRLSMPLVNEVVIGLKDKNLFNASEPKDDGQFAKYVTHPTLAALIQTLFPTVKAPVTPRTDLVAVFLNGNKGVNENGSTAEMQRLNLVDFAPTALAAQNNLGAAGCFVDGVLMPPAPAANVDAMGKQICDTAGFPNGRRPGDDVVDIELRVMIGALRKTDIEAPSRKLPLHDAVLQDASQFDNAFPYLKPPLPGAK